MFGINTDPESSTGALCLALAPHVSPPRFEGALCLALAPRVSQT